MQIEVIPQIELGSVSRLRIGDFLNKAIGDTACERFRFAVAYMRLSGLDRLGAVIGGLLNRGGSVSGAVGIDEEITSIEALKLLSEISSDSTIFYTVSGFIYHPKLYLMSGEKQAVAVVGSANLTGDGLFRNVELATAVYLDFEIATDFVAYKQYDAFINEFLDITHPNVQSINEDTIRMLVNNGVIKSETQTKEPGVSIRPKRKSGRLVDVAMLFPPMSVPVAPPRRKLIRPKVGPQSSVVAPPPTVGIAGTFVMQLSPFDSSHRSGRPGTPEVLIPQAAVGFFPPLSRTGRKHPEALFDVVLNTSTGRERHGYRLWFYADRTEWRLRMDHETIDLSISGGGDLLIINKLTTKVDKDLLYEVTILPQTDPTFQAFLSMCVNEAQEKKWGMIDT
jgi:HKD family nuclease